MVKKIEGAILVLSLLLFLINIHPVYASETYGNGTFGSGVFGIASCGDNICDSNEKESGCASDCGGFAGITKLQCAQSKGSWNDCGSPCAGTGAKFCAQVCSPQCECSGIAGFKCPAGYKCRLSGKISDEIGVCIK